MVDESWLLAGVFGVIGEILVSVVK